MTISSVTSRVSTLGASDLVLRQLQSTQRDLLENQRQTATGLAIDNPSDAADKVGTVLKLRQREAERDQYRRSLQQGTSVLNTADAALAEATQIVREATSIASSQVGIGSDEGTRAAEAEVIDASLEGLITLANRQYADLSVFGGDNGAAPGEKVFESFLGGVRYIGGTDDLVAELGSLDPEEINGNGVDAFGAYSSRVTTLVDLDPQAAADTRIADVDGAQNRGVRLGTVQVAVDGVTADVDLSAADTLGDVVDLINDGIASIDATAGSVAVSGSGLSLTAAGGRSVGVLDIGAGEAAADLGLDATAAGATLAGGDLGVALTRTTALADLGAGLDLSSGLLITQGGQSEVADFSGATTVEDLVNTVEQLDLGVRLQINADGTGLDLVSEVSGVTLTVGENGGTTAADLGVRTFDATTSLDDFRDGLGVAFTEAGEPDLDVTLHDGTAFSVDLAGSTTVGEVQAAIEAAATAAGAAVPGSFSVSLATTGNGLVLADNTVGGGDFAVTNANQSVAADHLGIASNAGAGNTIEGEDNAGVRVDNAFTHLIDLRNALENNDESGITLAGGSLGDDADRLVESRAGLSVQARRLEDQTTRLEDVSIAEQTMLSSLQDADLTEVITEYQRLQLQLQAGLQVGAQNLQLSLLDFLR